jgi:hypothetical protein
MVEVIGTEQFESWFMELEEKDAAAVARNVGLLEERGVALPFPYSSDVLGSRVALRELRVKSCGRQLRVFYAFDPIRRAVLLIGGDKTGDDRFYDRMIPLADGVWREYLESISREVR